jgi:glutathione peroxidase
MKQTILAVACIFASVIVCGQNVYSYNVNTIEGSVKQLSEYQGKRILFMTLPVVQNGGSDSLLHSLDSLAGANATSLVVVVAPSYEDGYTLQNRDSLKQWYRAFLRNSIIITDGLYSRKVSGNQQHPLFQWLTGKDKNGHFNQDVTGPANKFIVWNDGSLTGVFNAQTRLGGRFIRELLDRQ